VYQSVNITEGSWSFDEMMQNLKPHIYQTHNLSKRSLSKICSYEGLDSKAVSLLCRYEVWSNDGNLLKSGLKLWRESCAEVLKGKKAKELDENEGPFFPGFQHVFRKLELDISSLAYSYIYCLHSEL